MTHFAVIAPPLRGHYHPLSNLAAELIARGHRATFVHQEGARTLVEADGAAFEAIAADEPAIEQWTSPMSRIRGLLGLGATINGMQRLTTTFCREGPALMQRLGVDVIIADQLEPAGGLVAEHLGIPWISVADTLPMNREAGVPPPFVGWRYDPSERGLRRNVGGWWVSDRILKSFNQAIERNAAALGLHNRRRMEDCLSPLLQLAQLVPSLDFPRTILPPYFHYTGPYRRGDRAKFTLPESKGKRTVYASLGTLQGSRVRIFRKIAIACELLDLRLVLTHGGLATDGELKRLPGDTLAYDWVPQEAVLAQVDFVVCHGGMNTILDAAAAGLPMAVMPLTFEQPGIAARVERSGAGLMLSPHASAKTIAAAIARLRDEPHFRNRSQALRNEIRRAGGVSRAVDLIEQALGVSAQSAGPTRVRAAQGGARGGSRSGST